MGWDSTKRVEPGENEDFFKSGAISGAILQTLASDPKLLAIVANWNSLPEATRSAIFDAAGCKAQPQAE